VSAPKASTKPYAARLSLTAHALIHRRAREAGVSSREWLERAILTNRTSIITRKQNHADLGPLLFQVNRAGNNLNQVAHQLNSAALRQPIDGAQVKRAIELLVEIETALTEALARAG
jgi:hypothetical protein